MSLGWLKTVGMDILKGITIATQIAQGIDPLVQNTAIGKTFNTITSELGTIGNLTTIVESTANALGANTGANKLAAVLPYVSSLVQSSELIAGKHIADEAGFEAGCTSIINGVVQIQNSLKAQSTQSTPAQPPVSAPAPVSAVKKL
jgi:hypothetical protein